jgi:uncharacterized protein (DUF2267 family)
MDVNRGGSIMRVTKRLVQASVVVAGAVGAAAVAAPDTVGGRAVRQFAARLARDVRYAVAASPGILYRLAGRTPDPDVSDDVLADRIRSSIGGVLKRLDVPHVHVMVGDHIATLHGDVGMATEADAIEHAVLAVPGVDGVESHLHVGLLGGDTRPSRGRAAPQAPSSAMQALTMAATEAGASEPRLAVHAVLCRFVDTIPEGERNHVLLHLPQDVKDLIGPSRHGRQRERIRTFQQLAAGVGSDDGIAPEWAEDVTRRLVATLRRVVADEAADVEAVLPAGLREVWQPAADASSA